MSNPEFRQPDPVSALRRAVRAHEQVTEALREAAAEVRTQERGEDVREQPQEGGETV